MEGFNKLQARTERLAKEEEQRQKLIA